MTEPGREWLGLARLDFRHPGYVGITLVAEFWASISVKGLSRERAPIQ